MEVSDRLLNRLERGVESFVKKLLLQNAYRGDPRLACFLVLSKLSLHLSPYVSPGPPLGEDKIISSTSLTVAKNGGTSMPSSPSIPQAIKTR